MLVTRNALFRRVIESVTISWLRRSFPRWRAGRCELSQKASREDQITAAEAFRELPICRDQELVRIARPPVTSP